MTDRFKSILPLAIGGIALVVIVVGLSSTSSTEPTAEDRVAALSDSIKCPFCNGESLADSASGVAADYRALIAVRVAEGASDDEILDEFAANFGDSFILDTSTSGWSLALWLAPVVMLGIGIVAIVALRRSTKKRTGVEP
jgi:cytochrome c-type biogenesis protein CcmH